MKRQLILEDGTICRGEAFGSECVGTGEVVFNTGMTGYQEILSDPSYCGQIVTMTYPLIGNYGVNRDDFESIEPAIAGMIVKEWCNAPSNWRSSMSLDEYLKVKNIPGLAGIDTRRLTRVIREHGTLKGRICHMEVDTAAIIRELQQMTLPTNQVERVSTNKPYSSPGRGYRIAIVDFGMKHGILRELNKRDCNCFILPYYTTAEQLLREYQPDGIVLTNGPGDPKDVPMAMEMIQGVLGKVPLFGICLGHQLFALACGANTAKLKFGHRGSNHPVKHLRTGKVALTAQNHSYTVTESSLTSTRLEITHVALNDGTVEGLRHLDYDAFTVQYHPEAAPGPEDANKLFDQFINRIAQHKQERRHTHA